MKIKIRLTSFATVVFSLSLLFLASSADAATINAVSCSQEHVQAAVNAAVAGDTVAIPGGSCTWTASITVGNGITIQGAGKGNTIITKTGTIFRISGPSRITGMQLRTTSETSYSGLIQGSGKGWRIDNCSFFCSSGATYAILTQASSYANNPAGLIDHNEFTGHNSCRVVSNGIGSAGLSTQHYAWAYDEPLGSAGNGDAVYIEDNKFTSETLSLGQATDANRGGKYVFRFNTLTNSYCEAHAVQGGWSSTNRGTRSWELYHNNMAWTGAGYSRPFSLRAGTGVVFNNVLTGAWSVPYVVLDSRRTYDPVPDLCDGDSILDGNKDAYGWICRDQPGSGKDVALSVDLNYQEQVSQPVYTWGNTFPTKDNLDSDKVIHANRDYYDGGTWGEQTSKTSPFNGTAGTGRGTMANRPDTCTAGVGYYATDAPSSNWNTANGSGNDGALYKCLSTNNWQFYYKPYIYPHPLRTGTTPPVCTPSCTSKQCGDDGCGGSCGTCSTGQTCTNYQCASQTKTGDLNNDSKVDVQDLGIFLSNWGSTARPASDLNQDGKVDVMDLGILLSNWG